MIWASDLFMRRALLGCITISLGSDRLFNAQDITGLQLRGQLAVFIPCPSFGGLGAGLSVALLSGVTD